MFKRIVNISKTHSFFLFGPRSTGKTTLLLKAFPREDCVWINLLDSKIETLLRRDPEKLEPLIAASSSRNKGFVVIDEVQKNPALLDVVHRLIFEKKIKFALTGSSARKLKRGSANLLAGRAFSFECFPLTHIEIADQFNLNQVLMYGALPEIFELDEHEKIHFLRSYVETYFKEEVSAEQLVRNLIPFRNFLEVASQSNGKILNMNSIANDIGVDHTTVQNYFSVLEDTMLGFMLPPYHNSIRKRQRAKSKFYYFDLGVQRALSGRLEIPLISGNFEYGDAFEHFIILEFRRLIKYRKPDWRMSYFKSGDNAEIDLVIERPGLKTVLIEIKSTDRIQSLDAQKMMGFKNLVKDFKNSEAYLVSCDKTELLENGIFYLHWKNIFSRVGLSGN